MLIMDDLIPLRLYPAKRKVFAPFNEKDRKHGSAIFLMGTTQEENEKLMNMRYVYDPNKMFRSYYVDRNVMAYIDSDAINKFEDEEDEEFDEIQEAVLSEAIIHKDEKVKVNIINGSTMDGIYIKDLYSSKIDSIRNICGLNTLSMDIINVKFYTSEKVLNKLSPLKNGTVYSFYDDTTIHLLSKSSYNEDTMDGPYENYALNELVCFILSKGYPNINPAFYRAVAMVLSGQIEWFRENKDKEEFKPMDDDKENINNLYLADVLFEAYQKKGSIAIKRFLKGNLIDIRSVASGRIVKKTKELYDKYYSEATLTAEQRKNLKDSDYGLPDKKKYPMPDADHVKAAIRFFNHCDKEDEAKLAKAIKSKMKKYNVTAEIGKNNRLSNYITESAVEDSRPVANYPGLEYAKNGEIFMGNHSKMYYDVLAILDTFTMDEYKKVSFYSTYKDTPFVEKRIIHYDENGYPESFMDVYHFPSEPNKAQITTGVASYSRGKHLAALMFRELIDSSWAEENNVDTYIWHANTKNIASIKIATQELGFKGDLDKLDKYGRYTFVYHIGQENTSSREVKMPEIDTESGITINESAGFIFNEADSKYDRKIKRYLYKERLRNVGQVLSIYDQIKTRNPKITKTFRNIKAYRGLNVYVDTSYYHDLYLKNAPKASKRTLYMYFDFVTRLMDNEDVYKAYNKITYFFPIKYNKVPNLESMLDWSSDLNIFSVIVYLLRRDPEVLKRWANKDIIFLGDNGYFKIDFSTFNIRKLPKFKKNLKKILSKEEIPDVDEDDDDLNQEVISAKGNAIGVISSIEKNTGIDINNVSGVDTINISHLSMNDTEPKNIVPSPEGTAVLIIDADSTAVISDIKSDALKSKDISAYYKMR